ncbi:LacI family DNA-binding transcriptional regulator [Sporosarcina trichiuri]|uniref:LacI family DNA-binding transcriptional regulator n=1 Tax=Sporosarcina trichiuri TaxID=3056445 RepID=UPI0025B2F47D|nr:LacI family DNA-binding transcriptional regulator [Sporosarcina sp. 0.2-SM1T-5]WJY26287.1 LacI family DNA-binding transcriptional regulator [Sporosarcina sp. 0.2-SM1T-5]
MATIKDVSKLAGVSVATVSRYLNKNGYVSKEAAEAIAGVIDKLNYRPNTIARSLAGKKTATIGLLVPDILNPFFPELARAAEDAANEYGYTVMLGNTDNDTAKEQRYLDTLIHKQADGVIISSYTIQPDHLRGLQKAGIPVVLLDNVFSSDSVVSFTVENKEGGELAVRHLLERGCRKIAHICGPLSITSSRERTAGYEAVSTGTDWFTPGLIAYSDFTVKGGHSAMQQLLVSHPDLDGVFASNDLMAAGALKALQEAGRRVPEDVKVIGFDGIQLEMMSPGLSTVAQPIYELGKTAVDVLIGLITEHPDIPEDKVFPVSLTVRQSTGG